MSRALWSVPSAVVAWFLVGFASTYSPGDGRTLVPSATIDALVLGGVCGGTAAGLLVRRLRIGVPLIAFVAVVAWFVSRGGSTALGDVRTGNGYLLTLLTASVLGVVAGGIGSHRSVLAALALCLPISWYVGMPRAPLSDWRYGWELSGLLVAIALAVVLYIACWRTGWRAAYSWVFVATGYLTGFAVVAGVKRVATEHAAGRTADDIARAATDAFVGAFAPLLETYWPWLVAGAFLAIPMVALKIRALPPTEPQRTVVDHGSNDAYIPDNFDWFDREEPTRRIRGDESRRRLLPRRESA